MDTFLQDLRWGVRSLVRNLKFTIVAALTLALAIGGTSTVFGIVDGVMLRPLPYHDPDRLVALYETDSKGSLMRVSRFDFQDLRDQSGSFENLAAYAAGESELVGGSEPEHIIGAEVTPSFFPLFGVQPVLGRFFGNIPADDANSIIISERLWKARFGGNPGVLGEKIRLWGTPYVVIGVMPSSFDFPASTQAWVALELLQDGSDRSAHNYRVVARLSRQTDLKSAQAEASSIAARLAAAYPKSNKNTGFSLVPLQDALNQNIRGSLLFLLCLVGLVLLIASVNVAGLLLVRATSRYGEIATRVALGAGRWRLVSQILTESILLSIPAGLAGMGISVLLTRLSLIFSANYLLPSQQPHFDMVVLLFVIGVSLLSALLAGALPAIRLSVTNISGGLQRSSGADPWLQKLRKGLVSVEVALSLILLIGAGLATKSLLRLLDENLGLNPDHLIMLDIARQSGTPANNPNENLRFIRQTMESLKNQAGIISAAATDSVPLGGQGANGGFIIQGHPAGNMATWPSAGWHLVSEDYFQTTQTPIMQGRSFYSDGREQAAVVIINQTLAQAYWPNGDAIGKAIAVPGLDQTTFDGYRHGNNYWFTIVGIVGNVRHEALGIVPGPEIYFPYYQHATRAQNLTFLVRTSLTAVTLRQQLKSSVQEAGDGTSVRVRDYDSLIQKSSEAQRFRSFLVNAFAVLAGVLAAIGIYGLVTYSITQQRHEIGIRIALGAQSQQIRTLIAWQSFRFVLAGILAGLCFSFVLARLMSSFLYNMSSFDPFVFAGATLLLAIVAALACYIPAREASAVDPIVVLRYE
jgi:putative ABC transport system permease protein